MARPTRDTASTEAGSSSSAYQFRPRGSLRRTRWSMDDSDSEADDDEQQNYSSGLSSESSSDDEDDEDDDAKNDDAGGSSSSSSEGSTAATSDVDYASSDDELSETESMLALDELNSSDEEWGTPLKKGAKGKNKIRRLRHRLRQTIHPHTPRKRRAVDVNGVAQPSPAVTITPQHKQRILCSVSQAPNTLPARPQALDALSKDDLAQMTVAQRAKRLLHVGATPESLPCREEQFEEVYACLEDAVQEGLGGCVYVSGVPGTGKTATVREVIRTLQRRQQDPSEPPPSPSQAYPSSAIRPFHFVEINGMKLQDAHDAYGVLWHALTGQRCSNGMALYRLSRHFGTRLHGAKGKAKGARHQKRKADFSESESEIEDDAVVVGRKKPSKRLTTVVLLDELDQMVTARQDVMYNFFNWPNGPNSRLVVVAVANTMDLPERVLHAKVASRLGMTRITFRPYTDRQLVQIVQARLGLQHSDADDAEDDAGDDVHRGCASLFAPDAIVYLAKRVSNVSGDARRMLDVCRRAIDAQQEKTPAAAEQATATSISIGDMKRVLDAMVKSGKGAHVAHLATHAKVALVAILHCVRRAGTAEVDLAAVTATHVNLCRMHAIPMPQAHSPTTSVDGDAGRLQCVANIVSRLCALGLVIAVGSGVASAKSGKFARYVLACSDVEARSALEQDDDVRLRSML